MNNNKTTEMKTISVTAEVFEAIKNTVDFATWHASDGMTVALPLSESIDKAADDKEYNRLYGKQRRLLCQARLALGLEEFGTYVTTCGPDVAKNETMFAAYCQETLNVLNARQILEGPMPIDWNNYCETAQHVDPNGDWTNVEYTPDNLQALIYFYTEQLDNVKDIPVAVQVECSMKDIETEIEDMPTFITSSIEDVVAMSTTGGYDILSLNVLAQNVAGCIDETATTHIPVVELSGAQLTLIQIAMEFGMAHMKQMYTELCDGDMTIDNVTGYYEELDKMYKLIDKATFSDDFDIQIRN